MPEVHATDGGANTAASTSSSKDVAKDSKVEVATKRPVVTIPLKLGSNRSCFRVSVQVLSRFRPTPIELYLVLPSLKSIDLMNELKTTSL